MLSPCLYSEIKRCIHPKGCWQHCCPWRYDTRDLNIWQMRPVHVTNETKTLHTRVRTQCCPAPALREILHCNTALQHTTPHCNTLHRTATHYNWKDVALHLPWEIYCTALQHTTAPHCNTLQLKRCCPAPPSTMGVTQQPPNVYTRNPFKTCMDNHNDDEWFCCFKIDWYCLYYFRRDSLVALLEALFACNVGPCCRFYLLKFSWIRGLDCVCITWHIHVREYSRVWICASTMTITVYLKQSYVICFRCDMPD